MTADRVKEKNQGATAPVIKTIALARPGDSAGSLLLIKSLEPGFQRVCNPLAESRGRASGGEGGRAPRRGIMYGFKQAAGTG